MKRSLLVLFILVNTLSIFAQKQVKKTPVTFGDAAYWVQSKNYYLLTLFERDKGVKDLLENDKELSGITARKLENLATSIKECKDAMCYPESLKFSDEDIKQVSVRLTQLYKPGNVLDKLVKEKLISSGAYNLYNSLSPAGVLIKAWEQDAGAVNYAINVYAEGKKPNYPLIDSISYNVKSKGFNNLIYDASVTLAGDIKGTRLFFEPAMKAALLYLQINERDNAADYEPMIATVNKAAASYIKTINWAKYPYTNIHVPGAGPDNLTTPLSGEGMLRCRLAVQQYRMGAAPLIIVSGGRVHPYKTKYNEAAEMKKYLMHILNIPERAIILEPHARHTTTNLRNSARLIYEYGIPATKPGVIITDKSQTDFIVGMDNRCIKELGYVPYKLAKRLSDTEVEYYPLPQAKQIDPDEPLDP